MDLYKILKENRVVPVAVFNDAEDALKTGELLLTNGINLIEVTLRTEKALACIEALSAKISGLTVGAGSVLDGASLRLAYDAGAAFAISPGISPGAAGAAAEINMQYVPGAATPTEIMAAADFSVIIKLFPAALLGGPSYINAVAAPLASKKLNFIPTGGIGLTELPAYLSAENVIACGMSWLTDASLPFDRRYEIIDQRLKELKAVLANEC